METQKIHFSRETTTEILLGKDILKETASRLQRLRTAKKCTIITNEVVARWYLQPLIAELHSRGIKTCEIVIPDGEKHKSFATALDIMSRLSEADMDRDCPIVALGGGVICDLSGFVASIFKRGLPLVLLPTTLLAMVDACLGGKTAVNTDFGKNLAGTFYQPSLTIIDVAALTTLPLSQLSYGVVEAVKHGAIADAAYFKFILKNVDAIKSRQLNLLQRLIRRSIHVKRSFISEDELDQGNRVHLNFGHTFGHALEKAGSYIRLHHGEAVGLGMLLALEISRQQKILKEDYSAALLEILHQFGLPTEIPAELDKKMVIESFSQDKKKSVDGFKLILPVNLGKTIIKNFDHHTAINLFSQAIENKHYRKVS